MSSERNKVPLSEFITLQRGFDLPSKDRIDGTVPVVASTQIAGWHNEAKVEGPGVVIGRSGSIGGGQFIKDDFWPLNTTLWVKDFKSHNPEFVYYMLRSIDFERFNVGSGVPTLNRNHLSSVKVPEFDEGEEIEIANQLGTIDQKIHLNQQTNDTLEAMAQAIFKSWFVDFDPVRAKIKAKSAGYDPNRAAMAAIAGISLKQDWNDIETALDQKLAGMTEEQRQQLTQTAELFPEEFVESEIGEVPKGWSESKLEDYITLAYGKSLRKSDRNEGTVPVYGSGGLTGTHNESLINGPGIIVGRKGTVGSIYWEDKDFWPIDTVFYVQPKGNIKLPFCYYLLNTLGLDEMNTDAAVPGLNRNNAYRLKQPKFPDELIEIFSYFTSDLHGMIENKKNETKTLTEFRDTLLPKLISGEVGV